MDTVALCLATAQQQLDAAQSKYQITVTRPTRDLEKLDESLYYVIRQQIDQDGIYQLTVAAKVKKNCS